MSEKSEAPVKAKKVRAPKPTKVNRDDLPNPVWFKVIMFGFMLVGLIWILTFYISNQYLPLGTIFVEISPSLNLGNWNLLIGFGMAMIGFAMSTRWK